MSTSYLLVKKKGKELNVSPTKIRFSKSLKSIMEDASNALGTPKAIQTLYTEDGTIINNIHQIQNGQVLICSLLREDEKYDDLGNQFYFQQPPQDITEIPPQKQQEIPTRRASIPLPPDNLPKVPKLAAVASSVISPIKEDVPVVPKQQNRRKSAIVSTVKKDLSLDDESSDPDVEITDPQIEQISSPSQNMSKTAPQQSSIAATSVISELDNRSEVPESKSTIERNRILQSLIQERGEDIERAESISMYHSIVNNILSEVPTDYPPELDEAAFNILKKHTFTCPGLPAIGTLRGRIAITGPRNGGKSTFLSILTQKYLQFIISQGEQRNNCLFFYDFRNMRKSIKRPLQFYQEFVRSTITQLIAQYPLLRLKPERVNLNEQSKRIINQKEMYQKTPVADELMRVFLQYADLDTPITPLGARFPRTPPFTSIANDIEALCSKIETALQTTNDMNVFFTNVFLLPKNLAQAFGFDNVHYVVDHLDELDVTVTSSKPFGKDAKKVEVIEFGKLMMSNGSFFVAAENDERLSEILDKTDEYSFDLYRGTEFYSIVGTCENHSDLEELKLTLENGERVSVYRSDSGSCSGFNAKWAEIGNASKKIETQKKKMKILLRVRELVNELIDDLDQPIVDFEPQFSKSDK